MKSFDEWFKAQGSAKEDDFEDFGNGLYFKDGKMWGTCRSCQNDFEIDWIEREDAKDQDPLYVFCGGSPRCCP